MLVSEIADNIFHAICPRRRILAKTFLRIQEHMESPEFKGKIFTWDEYKEWYVSEAKKSDRFTYCYDWDGFNIPSKAFTPFLDGKFNPLSDEELYLLAEFKDKKTPFCVIGTSARPSKGTVEHELAHAFFSVYPDYRNRVRNILKQINHYSYSRMRNHLIQIKRYHSSVIEDEIHATLLSQPDDFDVRRINTEYIHRFRLELIDTFYSFAKEVKIKIPLDDII